MYFVKFTQADWFWSSFRVRRHKEGSSFYSCKSGRRLCQQNWNKELKTEIEVNENVLTHFWNSDILRCPLSFLVENTGLWGDFVSFFFFFFLFFFFLRRTTFSRTEFEGSEGHLCLQVQGHRQWFQCQCPVTNAQRPPLLYPAAYFMSHILQGSPALWN